MTLRAPTAAVLMPCIAAAAAHVAAWSAAGQTALWGLHHASFLPFWVPVALVAALAVALMPPVALRPCQACWRWPPNCDAGTG